MSTSLFHPRPDSGTSPATSPATSSAHLPPALQNLRLAFLAHNPVRAPAPRVPPAPASQSGQSTTTLHDPPDPSDDELQDVAGKDGAGLSDDDADSLFSADGEEDDDAPPTRLARDAYHCAHCAHCRPLDAAHALIAQLDAAVVSLAAANRALRRRLAVLRAATTRLVAELAAERHKSNSSPGSSAGTAQPPPHSRSPMPAPDTSVGSGLTELLDAFPPTSPTSERSETFYSLGHASKSSETLPSPQPPASPRPFSALPSPRASGSSQRARFSHGRSRRNTGASATSPRSPDLDALAVPFPAPDSASVRSLPFAQRTGARPGTGKSRVSFDLAPQPTTTRTPRHQPRLSPMPAAPAPPDARTKIPVLSSIRSSARKLRDTISRRASLRPAETSRSPPPPTRASTSVLRRPSGRRPSTRPAG